MKPTVILLLLLSMLLSLAACGGGGGSKEPVGVPMLGYAKELSDEVDKTPLATEIGVSQTPGLGFGDGGVTVVPGTGIGMGTGMGGVQFPASSGSGVLIPMHANLNDLPDITDPAQNPHYQDYLEWGRLTMDTTYTRLTNGDNFVGRVKEVKDRVVSFVTQMNTWVTFGSWRMRMQYDPLTDVVTLEQMTHTYLDPYGAYNTEYYRIRASRNERGEAVIEAITVNRTGDTLNFRSSLRFYENDSWLYTSESDSGTAGVLTKTAIYSDIRQGEIFCLAEDEIALLRRGELNSYMVAMPEEIGELCLYLDGKDGERVGGVFENTLYGSFTAHLDLYELKGWSKLFGDATTSTLLLSDGRIIGNTDTPTVLAVLGCEVSVATLTNACPKLYLSVRALPAGVSRSALITAVLGELSLSVKDASVLEVLSGYDELDAYRADFSFLEIDGCAEPSRELLDRLFSRIVFPYPSDAELLTMTAEPSIPKAEQIPDGTYLAIWNATLTGDVTVSPDGILDLSAVTVTAASNILLEEGGEYLLTVALSDGLDLITLGESSIVWQQGPLSISGISGVSLSTAPVGEYSLVVFLAKRTGLETTRLSDKLPLSSQNTLTVTETVESHTRTLHASPFGITLSVTVSEAE